MMGKNTQNITLCKKKGLQSYTENYSNLLKNVHYMQHIVERIMPGCKKVVIAT